MGPGRPISWSPAEHARMAAIEQPQAPSFDCGQCNGWLVKNSRNLVVCIDGTSNEFGQNHTNVVKLFSKIDVKTVSPEQHAYYIGGIGTDPKSSHNLSRMGRAIFDKLDMAVGWNVDKIIKEAYRWLAGMYRAGDRIYLFGFSRGAYQARVLAAMIHEVGLTMASTQKQVNRAYAHHRAIYSGRPGARDTARNFKELFSQDCLQRVHFVGVWDTVSSVGFIKGTTFLSTSSCASHACHFRHALALDERRVKFMPEYFLEMNARTDHERSEYIISFTDNEYSSSDSSRRRGSTMSDNGIKVSSEKKSDIKEVWFPGCHSDVGGVGRSGTSHNAGNVSLSWMRREAEANGLVLRTTDTVWLPGDLDFGVSDSMTRIWHMVEYVPIKHQVSFSGFGDDSRRWHRLQPRRIIPGQKVHASILYANTYKPRASLGEGFEVPVVHAGPDAELDHRFWETGLFDKAAAEELVACLGDQEEIAPIYLDRLLFILGLQEGKDCVRNVPNWQRQFLRLIHNRDCAPLVRLITIVAYYEASIWDPDARLEGSALPHVELPQETFDDAKKSLHDILDRPKHRDGPRVIALLRPLTKHQVLRERILTQDILSTLMELFDNFIEQQGDNFRQAMDGLNCLLQCEDTQQIIVERLRAPCTHLSSPYVSRLSWILEITDSDLLVAALGMIAALTRIPEARDLYLIVTPRLKELAEKDKRIVGILSVEILLAIDERDQLDIRNANIRANLAGALVRLSPEKRSSTEEVEGGVDPGLHQLFGVDATKLNDSQEGFIKQLKSDIQKGTARKRTAATLAVLELCKTEIVRKFLCANGLLRVFIDQMKHKDRALLAAHALAECLKEAYMKKESIKDNETLVENIVYMLRLDYFDDAVGKVEGFQIFGEFMRHDDLRGKIKDYNIIGVLNAKLFKDKPKETRTCLICLDILHAFDENSYCEKLVTDSLRYLRSPTRKAQKAGVAILCALVQTERGVEVIRPKMTEIINMLLAYTDSATAVDTSLTRSQLMETARALRALTQHETLRKTTRDTQEYNTLKHLHLSGAFTDKMSTSLWRIKTLSQAVNIIDILGKTIQSVDEAS